MTDSYDRFAGRRVSRRRLLAGAGGMAMGAAALGACKSSNKASPGRTPSAGVTGTPGPRPTQDESQVTKDGVYHGAFGGVLPSLSLFGATALYPSTSFGWYEFDHLFYVPRDTQKPEPMLAYQWEQPDPEGLTTIFKMQPSVFHDMPPVNGRNVLASDVKASYEAYAADNLYPGREWHHKIMEAIEAPEDLTVIIKQKRPYAWLFHPGGAGGIDGSCIMAVETLDPAQFDMKKNVLGSGRWMIVENRGNEYYHSMRHPNWRIKGEPWLAESTNVYVSQPAQIVAMFKAGELDQTYFSNKLECDAVEREMGTEKMSIGGWLDATYHTLQLNLDRVPEFKDERVRKAIRLAVNRDELIQLVRLQAGDGIPAGPIPAALEAFALSEDETADYFKHDAEEAKRLLEVAGFPMDKELTLVIPTPVPDTSKAAQVLKDQFGAVGLKVKIQDVDGLSVFVPRALPKGEFDMTTYVQLPFDDPHYPIGFYTKNSAKGDASDSRGSNNMAFFDDEITAAVEDAERTLDIDVVIEKVKDVERLIMKKEAPMINLFHPKIYGASWNWFKGVDDPWRGAYSLFNGRTWIDTRMRKAD